MDATTDEKLVMIQKRIEKLEEQRDSLISPALAKVQDDLKTAIEERKKLIIDLLPEGGRKDIGDWTFCYDESGKYGASKALRQEYPEFYDKLVTEYSTLLNISSKDADFILKVEFAEKEDREKVKTAMIQSTSYTAKVQKKPIIKTN